jgi:hypothetical protein
VGHIGSRVGDAGAVGGETGIVLAEGWQMGDR